MPSAYGHTNGHHLVNTNSMAAALTNGQTPSSAITASSTSSPHRVGTINAGSHGGHPSNQTQTHGQAQAPQTNEEVGIREVWAHNLDEEFIRIRKIVQHYPFVAMDTEFPGVVAKPIGQFTSNSEYMYQIMRSNITLLKIIQIGLTFMNAEGKKPDGFCTWQFNFRFNLNDDMYAHESIELLTNSGIQFNKHDQDGIDPTEFAVLLIGSGVVLSDQISWLSFHSGYDFGYLLKMLTDQQLPKKETEFFELLKIYFPRIYDLKYLMKSTKDLKGGLQEVAEALTLVRKGPQHQAGSDSLLTGETFFKLKEMYFENDIEEKRYSGFLYGLETAETGKNETDDDLAASGVGTNSTTGNRNTPTTTNTSLSVTNTTTNGAATVTASGNTSNGSNNNNNNNGTNDSSGNKTDDGNASSDVNNSEQSVNRDSSTAINQQTPTSVSS
uniref:poly(A)-specific ribonuclease n=1 Tax=Dermatophagoides pteronyssinus TaxID=6956 RepID=A0A6P6YLU7_DERPT|nr:CCR4-NOT transcription complex subunit 7-like [Dermatophagoides pteronyssinus]XP_027205945.1 CCR4-NOT transcription complex subunit 7-like [Dermatophagoides pteronyssinus]